MRGGADPHAIKPFDPIGSGIVPASLGANEANQLDFDCRRSICVLALRLLPKLEQAMARIIKAQSVRTRAEEFRASVSALLCDRYNDWTDWELDWLAAEERRHHDYTYSEKEWAKLMQLQHYARSFTGYADYSVSELTAIAYADRFNFQEHEEAFAEKVHRWRATHLKRRQICFLADLCRRSEDIGHDPLPDHRPVEESEPA